VSSGQAMQEKYSVASMQWSGGDQESGEFTFADCLKKENQRLLSESEFAELRN